MALKSKKKSTVSLKQILQINPYELKDNVLELMGQICSAKEEEDYYSYVKSLYEAFDDFEEFFKENFDFFHNIDFKEDLEDIIDSYYYALGTSDCSEYTKVVVAGGFSSGKSSFLNRLTNHNGLLPTGTQPVSVVLTYLYCSTKTPNVRVQALNHQDTVVELNTDVLQAIQHSNASNVHLASVLKKLYVRIPSKQIDNIVFIDTPGYNNSNLANDINGKTDRESALQGLKDAQVMIWLISSIKGTISADDMEMIKEFDGPTLVVFSKADQKDKNDPNHTESRKIVTDAYNKLLKELSSEKIIDVISYSIPDDEVYYSKKGHRHILDFVKIIKNYGHGKSFMDETLNGIEKLFKKEISEIKDEIKEEEERHTRWVVKKNARHKLSNDNQEAYEQERENLMEIKEFYLSIHKTAENFYQIAFESLKKWGSFLNWIKIWDRNRWNSDKDLEAAYNNSSAILDEISNNFNNEVDKYPDDNYSHTFVQEVYDGVFDDIDYLIKLEKDNKANIQEKCKEIKDYIEKLEKFEHNLSANMEILIEFLNESFNNYSRTIESQIKKVYTPKDNLDVFKVIDSGNLNKFMKCFENGLDLGMKGPEGYNVFTYTVMKGETEMVKFILAHNGNPRLLDDRGFSPFHTAVENHNFNICKQILEIDPEIIYTNTKSGLDITEIMELNTFSKWLICQ